MNAYLLLANGMVFAGQSVGAQGVTVGEVVFATGMVGFQETLTDPSYYGQIITQTYPLIGNYGMNHDDMESDRIWAKGYIVREACTTPSNWRCEETLDSFLKKNNTIGIEGIDTRHLTRIIRESGVMNGAILTTFDPADPANKAETEALLAEIRAYAVTDAVKNVTCAAPEVFNPEGETHIVLMHYGCKRNIVRCLVKRGCKVTVMPAFATAEEIKALAPDKDALKLAQKVIADAGIKSDDKGTKALFFMSTAQAKALAELAVEGCKDKKQYKEALKAAPSADMALFGRMVADDPSLNYDAAAQVAHSISTHTVQNEFDYFTAVDDCAPEDNAGAGHLGTVEYNSATLYRYATVNVLELVRTLGAEQAAQTVRAFGEAFIRSMPTGKQNSFANRTLPDAVYITLRQDQPVNLCGAFEKPVRKSEEGYAEPSKMALKQYAKELYNTFAEVPEQSFTVGTGLEELAQPMPLNTMLAVLEKAVEEKLSGNEV